MSTEIALARVQERWSDIVQAMRTPENAKALNMWLSEEKVRPLEIEDDAVVLSCPTPMFSSIITSRYIDDLQRSAQEVCEIESVKIVCKVSPQASQRHQERQRRDDVEVQIQQRPLGENAWGRGFKLLQDFVVGSCNRLAFDAVQRMIEEPDKAVNPLFIHGSSGLGKTHLIQGLGIAFRDRYPHSNVQYQRCEQFTNDYVNASQEGSEALNQFRMRNRHADLYLIDDIHFLSRGLMKKTKDELFETFKVLAESGKKVVITSDAAPNDIKYLEDRFVQRFSGGLVAPLDRPGPKLRADIIERKAEALETTMPAEVVDYIASHIVDNVRELEGAVNKIIYMARSFRRSPDIHLARKALSDMLGSDSEEPRFKVILRAVADYYDLTVEDILGKGRSGNRSEARHVAMYVHKSSGGDTYASVGQAFGRSHSAVSYACQEAAKYRSTNENLDSFIEELLVKVRRR